MEGCEDERGFGSKVCRLCLGSTDVTVHIGRHVKSSSIAEKIHYCTSLTVKVGDSFPQNICTTCVENLDLIYNFKSKAIACDLELSKNEPNDLNFTYIQVSDDPINRRYKLDLEEQESTILVGDSCVFNIIDGDELKIEPVKITNDLNEVKTAASTDTHDSLIDDSLNLADSHKLKVISNKLNGSSKNCQDSNLTNNDKKHVAADLKRNSSKSLIDDVKSKPKKIKTKSDIDDEKSLLIVKNGKVIYMCGVCSFEAESMPLLLNHRTRSHSNNVGDFKCTECSSFYKTPGLLKRHISLHHDVVHVCKYCEKRFLNKQGLDRHINAHHNITPLEFQCVKCNAYFDTMDKMEDHLVVHYTNPSSTFTCNHCDRSFTTFAAKNKHIDLEHFIEIECNICHVILPTKEAMDKHNNSVHQPKKKGNKMYACTKCGKYFSSIKEILSHRETHLSN